MEPNAILIYFNYVITAMEAWCVAGCQTHKEIILQQSLLTSDAIWFVDEFFKLGKDGGRLLVRYRSVSEFAGFSKAT